MSFINHIKIQYRKPHKRKSTYRDLESKLNRIFSEYIRLKAANKNGYVKCITCGKVYHWKDMRCGHYISRAYKTVRFNEINCNPQCVKCNSFRYGEPFLYRIKLIEIHGGKTVKALEEKAQIGGGYKSYQLKKLINEYKEKVKQIKRDKYL